jgi:hypothetical protein
VSPPRLPPPGVWGLVYRVWVCVCRRGVRVWVRGGREGGRSFGEGGGVVFSQFLKILCEVPPPGPEGGTRALFAKTLRVPGKEGGGTASLVDATEVQTQCRGAPTEIWYWSRGVCWRGN